VREDIERLLDRGEHIKLAVAGDVSIHGQFEQNWLIATDRRLLRLACNGDGEPDIVEIPLSEATAIEKRGTAHSGVVEVRTDNGTVPLFRCTGATSREIDSALPELQKLIENNGATELRLRRPRRARREARCEKCGQPIPYWSGVCLRCVDKRRLTLRMLARVKPYWAWAALSFALMLGITLADLAPPYLTKILIDRVIPQFDVRLLAIIVGAIFAVSTVSALIGVVRGCLVAWLGQKIIYDLRKDLYGHLQELSVSFYDVKQTGWIMDRVTRDTGNLERFLAEGLQEALRDGLTLLLIGVILFFMNWRLALLTLLPTPILAVLTMWFIEKMHVVFHRAWRKRSRLTSLLADVIPGVRVVRSFAQERQEIRRFDERSREFMEANVRAGMMAAKFFPSVGLLTMVGYLIIWGYGGYQAMHPHSAVTVGTLVAFIEYLWMFYHPLQNLSRMSHRLQHAVTSAQRVFEVLDMVPEVVNRPGARPLPNIKGRVEFRNVTFSYEPGRPVLKNVSFVAEPGEMIGLVGPSGAGKSTTINLLCRFYDVDEGQILIDGVDIRDIELESYRSQLGVVLQEPFLFSGTVAENIAYGNPDASIYDIIRAAKAANAHQFIMTLPDAYDTMVGERGLRLSGGERQRISIARAILKDPRILILDEATSSVDTETERDIREAMERLIANRTTFAIAHRLSTLKNASRLIVLDNGEMVEEGTHEELLEKGGLFKKLVDMQSELAKIVAVGG